MRGGNQNQDWSGHCKKDTTHLEKGRRCVGWYGIGDGGDVRRHNWSGPRKYLCLRGQNRTGLVGEKKEPGEGGIGTGQDKKKQKVSEGHSLAHIRLLQDM